MTTNASLAIQTDRSPQSVPLKAEALALLRGAFAIHGHQPSPDQWRALEALLETFDQLVLDPQAEAALYLSALDPGVGKTSAVVAYLTALLRSEGLRHVGVLVTLSRLSEIRRIVEALNEAGGTVAVRTSDEALNALSTVEDPSEAQVLIITQQRLELLCSGRSLGDIASLCFHGQARGLRIWDEAFLPGTAITVSSDDLAAILRWLRPKSLDFHRWVEGIRGDAEKAKDGDVIPVPAHDFLDKQMTLGDALRLLRGKAGDQGALAEQDETTLKALWAMAGRMVTVRRDDTLGPTLVSFTRSLPGDLLPLVVLDASARVRKTYDLMAQALPVIRLPSATKDYRALTIHVWRRGGGKASMRDKAKFNELTEVIADAVTKEPERPWLVVAHKPGSDIPDLGKALTDRLDGSGAAVDLLTWGNHAATNNFADVDRVVLAGTLFLRPSSYEALARASVLQDPDDKAFSPEEIEEVERGEHGHLVLQALCRAAVRRGNAGGSGACEAYLIASKRSGIEALLPELFPGCCLKEWKPKGPRLPGHAKAALDFLSEWARGKTRGAEITFVEVYRSLGIHPDVFRKEVRRNEDLPGLLADLGIFEDGTEKRKTKYALGKKRVK